MSPLDRIKIILVEPAGALNVGSIARVMKNMGLSQLVLVNPQCDVRGEETRLMAVRAADVLDAAVQVETLLDALQGCQRAIATVGRDCGNLAIEVEAPRTALPWLLTPEPLGDAALIFGREDRGLSNVELNYAQRHVRIPSNDVYPSLNLAQAVAICCYELFTASCLTQASGSQTSPSPSAATPSADRVSHPGEPLMAPAVPYSQSALATDLATREAMERFYQTLEALLLDVGYLFPHTASSRMKKFRRLLNRAYPSEKELRMLQGIISQVEWALQRGQFHPKSLAAEADATESYPEA